MLNQKERTGTTTKSSISEKVHKLFQSENRYLNSSEVSQRIQIPRSTISSCGIKTDEIALSYGFKRNGVSPKANHSERKEYIDELIRKWKSLIQEKQEVVSLYKFAESFGLPLSKVSRFYRYGLDPMKIHTECGIEYHANKKMCSKKNAEIKLRELISAKKRYVTRNELADALGVSGSSISLHKIPVAEINLEYGYTGDWRTYEMYVKEIFDTFRPGYKLELQKTFDKCRTSPSNRSKLRYDFYCEELSLLIEVDGPSHYDNNNQWYSTALVERDRLKTSFAEANGMKLIRIKYDEKYSRSYIESFLSGIPLKHGVGQPAAKPDENQEGSTTSRKT